MTPTRYREERLLRGTQAAVAQKLEVYTRTLRRRETGETPVTKEAELALLSLPLKVSAK